MKKIISFVAACMIAVSASDALAMADTAECACVINPVTNEVVFEKEMNKKHAMASTTKIMTAVIALENCGEDEVVTVSANAANQEGSSAYISAGNQMYMGDVLNGLMLNSGNDAAIAIAEHVAGNVEAFADMMNKKAAELGAVNTHFVNPSGLDDPQHYTTASDMALIAKYAMGMSKFREIVSTSTAQVKPINSEEMLYFTNHNKLLHLYDGATGIKTGFTKSTGRCLVSSAKRDGMEFIAVTLNDPNDWKDHEDLLDYAFSQYEPKRAVNAGDSIKQMNVGGGVYNMTAVNEFVLPVRKGENSPITVISHISENLRAPLNKGEKVGYLEIQYKGKEVGKVDVISEEEIALEGEIIIKENFFSVLLRCLKKILL